MITASTFKCDRDGVEAAGAPGMFWGVLPDGWTLLNLNNQTGAPASGHLCPACSSALIEFMNAHGGGFMQPSTPPGG